MTILHLDSGLFVDQSVSRKLSKDIVAQLNRDDSHQVVYRDLVTNPIAHLDAAALSPDEPIAAELIAELKQADIIVIGAPMYNFTIPSQLKAWLDRVLKAGVTFEYTEQGPRGLLQGKTVYLASGRGGVYSEGEAASMDFQESYLKTALAFIGITDVHVIRAEGVAMGDEPRQQALNAAEQAIAEI
ncbi:FMN-dependent NADH-azoreductase [Pseudidiomarina taiwanensis]|uniref:FMN dependent NADH:quinone oxidoreductase n=1 Tax=Pseudidiomarina taiwanensis TaxID=337250 RepID=A0A432ZMP7_9GAMM|nr:NAD(P)H-dependent oxidoreductase [Pseudidiomarina taiwanensis]RUO79163.1 FMN-dependent NADH-azoreductase [Pseudidiomarina taiwanensis]